MSLVFIVSVILKGIGAVLEVLLQILITRGIGLAGYGAYSAWINTADLIFWVLYSGLIKCNTFYLSGKDCSIQTFRRRYYSRYVLPTLGAASLCAAILGRTDYLGIFAVTAMEAAVMDRSSVLLAQGNAYPSLLGEYVLGRAVLLLGLVVMMATGTVNQQRLAGLYGAQYVIVLLFLGLKQQKGNPEDISGQVSLKKWAGFQRSDAVHAMMGQLPVLLQYFFSGALEAGVVSVVLLVKKLIGFVSGPSSKIFLPEFSRLYRAGKTDEIRGCFASVMRMQMIFAAPLAVILMGYPNVVLGILAEELLPHKTRFVLCAAVFLLAATVGPCSGVMLMTGHEKQDNRIRETATAAMLGMMLLMREDRLFVLYGLCAQTILETGSKYWFVCRWMKKAPIPLKVYLGWWIVPLTVIALTYALGLENSLLSMLLAGIFVFALTAVRELKTNSEILQLLKRK